MDKTLAKLLARLVNDPDMYPLLLSYTSSRITLLLSQLETEIDVNRVKSIQAAIAELRRFTTLKEEVWRSAEG
jgi:hypothetical protein